MTNIIDKFDFLRDFSIHDGTEYGEMIDKLLSLFAYRSLLDEPLVSILEAEIDKNYEYIKENFERVEEEHSYKVISYVEKDDW